MRKNTVLFLLLLLTIPAVAVVEGHAIGAMQQYIPTKISTQIIPFLINRVPFLKYTARSRAIHCASYNTNSNKPRAFLEVDGS